ncbi:MAG: uracil phosphoribosyltransferase [Rickettsiales bacterium]|nr:uracil phosphoribosyltransferase [Rickettsiales bacterium]
MVQRNTIILNEPIVAHHLSIIRDKNTDMVNCSVKVLSDALSLRAMDNLPLMDVEIETPVAKTKAKRINSNIDIFIVPILRAGLGIAEHLFRIIPSAKVQHLGMYRDEKTLKPVWYYNKLPKTFRRPDNTIVYICDPMLATGGSIIEAIKLYTERGVPQKNITLINLICSQQGIDKVYSLFPDVRIVTCAVDEKLNEKGYIVPGLGDAGDRIFNTIY